MGRIVLLCGVFKVFGKGLEGIVKLTCDTAIPERSGRSYCTTVLGSRN